MQLISVNIRKCARTEKRQTDVPFHVKHCSAILTQLRLPPNTRNCVQKKKLRLEFRAGDLVSLSLTFLFSSKRVPFQNCGAQWPKAETRVAFGPVVRPEIDVIGISTTTTTRTMTTMIHISNVYRRYTIRNDVRVARKRRTSKSAFFEFLQSSSGSLSITCSPVFNCRVCPSNRVLRSS